MAMEYSDKCEHCGKSKAAHLGPLRCCPPRYDLMDRDPPIGYPRCENCGLLVREHEDSP